MAAQQLSGSFRLLFLFDVAEEIPLDEMRRRQGAPEPVRLPAFAHAAPEYVRFADPPVVEDAGTITLSSGETLQGQLHYYAYGVVGIELAVPFSCGWSELVQMSARWIDSTELEAKAAERVRQRLDRHASLLVKPAARQLSEDYYIVQLHPMPGMDAAALLRDHGDEIAQIVRGECQPLSAAETAEVLQSHVSYYPSDLLVAGWTAAFNYDTPDGGAATTRLLEYANSQLLEFRHYDDLLSSVLAGVYRTLERRPGLLQRWRMAREAERLNTILLEVRDLTERADNAIKFLSDMYAARLYRVAAARIGAPDYRRLVDEKLRTTADLYRFLIDQHNHGRAFILELMVVIILIIDLIYLFRGRHV